MWSGWTVTSHCLKPAYDSSPPSTHRYIHTLIPTNPRDDSPSSPHLGLHAARFLLSLWATAGDKWIARYSAAGSTWGQVQSNNVQSSLLLHASTCTWTMQYYRMCREKESKKPTNTHSNTKETFCLLNKSLCYYFAYLIIIFLQRIADIDLHVVLQFQPILLTQLFRLLTTSAKDLEQLKMEVIRWWQLFGLNT